MDSHTLICHLLVAIVVLYSVHADEEKLTRERRSGELVESLNVENELKRVKRLDDEEAQLKRVKRIEPGPQLTRQKRVRRNLQEIKDALELVKRSRRQVSSEAADVGNSPAVADKNAEDDSSVTSKNNEMKKQRKKTKKDKKIKTRRRKTKKRRRKGKKVNKNVASSQDAADTTK